MEILKQTIPFEVFDEETEYRFLREETKLSLFTFGQTPSEVLENFFFLRGTMCKNHQRVGEFVHDNRGPN